MDNGMSPADIRAVMGGEDDNGWNGNGAWWIIVLFLFAFRGGWGGYGNGDGQPVTEAGLCNAMNFNNLENQVGRMADNQAAIARQQDNAICNLGYTALENTNTIMSAIAANQATNQQCCCETQKEILVNRYENEKQTSQILAAIKESQCATENMFKDQRIRELEANNAAQDNALMEMKTQNMIQAATCGIPRLPQQFTYSVPFPFFNNGCCNTGCQTVF